MQSASLGTRRRGVARYVSAGSFGKRWFPGTAAETLQATSLLDFFYDPARDRCDHFARSEARRFGEQPVVCAGDGDSATRHHGSVAVESDLFGRHRTDLLEETRILQAGALG